MYIVELSPEAQADMRQVRSFHRPAIYKALAELSHQAAVETRHRKPLPAPLADLPDVSWEVRVRDYRALYAIKEGDEQQEQTVRVVRVILKGTATTQDAMSKTRTR